VKQPIVNKPPQPIRPAPTPIPLEPVSVELRPTPALHRRPHPRGLPTRSAMQHPPNPIKPVDALGDVHFPDLRPVPVVPPKRPTKTPKRRPVPQRRIPAHVRHPHPTFDPQHPTLGGGEVGPPSLHPPGRPPTPVHPRRDHQMPAPIQSNGIRPISLNFPSPPGSRPTHIPGTGINDPIPKTTVKIVSPDTLPPLISGLHGPGQHRRPQQRHPQSTRHTRALHGDLSTADTPAWKRSHTSSVNDHHSPHRLRSAA